MHTDKLRNPNYIWTPLSSCLVAGRENFYRESSFSSREADIWSQWKTICLLPVITVVPRAQGLLAFPTGQRGPVGDQLPAQSVAQDRHRPAARGAPLPVPHPRGQAHPGHPGRGVCHGREWVLSAAVPLSRSTPSGRCCLCLLASLVPGIAVNDFWCSVAFWQLFPAFCLSQVHNPYADMWVLEVK